MKRPIDDVNKRVSGGSALLPKQGTHVKAVCLCVMNGVACFVFQEECCL